jgi:hypothetical protein
MPFLGISEAFADLYRRDSKFATDQILPLSSDDWSEAQRKYQEGLRVLEGFGAGSGCPPPYVLRHEMIARAVQEGDLDHGIEVLNDMGRLAEADGEKAYLNPFFNERAVDDLLRALVEKRDRDRAEMVMGVLFELGKQHLDVPIVRQGLRAAWALMGILCAALDHRKDLDGYLNSAFEFVDWESDDVKEMDWVRDVVSNVIVVLVKNGEWAPARQVAWDSREVLMEDGYFERLAERDGREWADSLRDLFEAHIEAYQNWIDEGGEEARPPEAVKKSEPVGDVPLDRGTILNEYDFQKLVEVSVLDGVVTLAVPQRWIWQKCPDSDMWGFWEDDTESGTLWVDYDLYTNNGATPEEVWRWARETFETHFKETAEKRGASGHRILEMPDRLIQLHELSCEEQGEKLDFLRCHVVVQRPGQFLMVHFSFVILSLLREREDFLWLWRRLEQEFIDARIDFDRLPD